MRTSNWINLKIWIKLIILYSFLTGFSVIGTRLFYNKYIFFIEYLLISVNCTFFTCISYDFGFLTLYLRLWTLPYKSKDLCAECLKLWSFSNFIRFFSREQTCGPQCALIKLNSQLEFLRHFFYNHVVFNSLKFLVTMRCNSRWKVNKFIPLFLRRSNVYMV